MNIPTNQFALQGRENFSHHGPGLLHQHLVPLRVRLVCWGPDVIERNVERSYIYRGPMKDTTDNYKRR